MKRNVLLTLTLWILLVAILVPMTACTTDGGEASDGSAETQTEGETLPDPIDPESYGYADITYKCEDNSILRTYKDKTAEDFAGVRSYFLHEGYSVYTESEKAGNYFCTLTNGADMAHVYWIASSAELSVVSSKTAGETLPPVLTPEEVQGNVTPTVTQMRDSSNVNGMCYIVQLPDGSFIVYDGSYEKRAKKVMQQIEELHVGEGKPLIRAWVLTHSHDDHHPTFSYFCNKYASDVQVDYVIFAPIEVELAKQIGGDDYFNVGIHEDITKLGAQLVYAHTGMEFVFGEFKMEVLLAADDLFKVGNHNNYFNNSSLVTRIYTENYSALLLGDIGKEGTDLMTAMYGAEYLKSNICQVSHHGVEDVPLEFYEIVQASILYYPCNLNLYNQTERHYEERKALEERSYTKEILIAGLGQYTREWGTTFAEDAPLSIPDYKKK